jgi:flagellar FliL protein
MFGRKKKAPQPAAAEPDEDKEDERPPEAEEESPAAEKAAPLPPGRFGGMLGLILSAAMVTVVAGGMGVGLGMKTAATVAKAVAAETAAAQQPAGDHIQSIKFTGDMVLKPIDAVVTNLASPSDTWIRLETAMVFKNGAIANPEVTAAELRQDMVAYVRTITLAQLEGASALEHLREDLNERAALRTDGAVSEVVIQTLVVQ